MPVTVPFAVSLLGLVVVSFSVLFALSFALLFALLSSVISALFDSFILLSSTIMFDLSTLSAMPFSLSASM